jgi:hypothetical protein
MATPTIHAHGCLNQGSSLESGSISAAHDLRNVKRNRTTVADLIKRGFIYIVYGYTINNTMPSGFFIKINPE